MSVSRALVGVLLLSIVGGGFLPAQEQPTAPLTAPSRTGWQYRQYFIPDRNKSELTRGYLPMRRDQFEQLVAASQLDPTGVTAPSPFSQATYLAVLDGDTLRDGVALWEFQADSQPRAVTLEPLGLAIREPRWQQRVERPQCGSDRQGRWQLMVPEAGTLVLPWSLQGTAEGGRRSLFDFRSPACPVATLLLAVPPNTLVEAEPGLVSHRTSNPDPTNGLPEGAAFRAAVEAGATVFQIDLSGSGECRLASRAAPPQNGRGTIRVRQTQRYTLLPSRIELQAELHFDCVEQSLEAFELTVSAELRLLEARFGDQILDWTVAPVAGGLDAYRFRLSPPITGVDRAVRLVFHGDLIAEREWQLPTVRIREDWWSEGRTELVVADSLQLQDVRAGGAQLTRRSVVSPGVETLEFQALSSEATYDLLLRPRAAAVRVAAGSAIRMDRDSATARVLADLQADWGESFRLRIRLARPWSVDRVEVTPNSALDTAAGSWRFENGVLEIPLREPITAGRSLRLAIDAHRPAPPERAGLDGSQLGFLEFLEVSESEYLVRVETPPPLRVRLLRDVDVQRIDPSTLTPAQHGRLGDASRGLVLRLQPTTVVSAVLVQDVPSFSAEVAMQATLEGTTCEESYVIHCAPESYPLRQVRVQLSQKRSEPMNWTLDGQEDSSLAARLVVDPERTDGGAGDELWEIELPEAMSDPFAIRGSRRWERDGHVEVAFASVPQAIAEAGRVVVRSRHPVRWEASGLEPVPMDREAQGQSQGLRGVFRYQPSHASHLTIWPALANEAHNLWAWHAQLTTRCFADGRSAHEAVFRLENLGQDRIAIRFPESVTVTGLWIDGRAVPLALGPLRDVAVPLSPATRFPVVRLRFATQSEPLGLATSRTAPFPHVDAPILQADWTVLAPQDYHAVTRRASPRTPAPPAPGLLERLCGSLVRQRPLPTQADQESRLLLAERFLTELDRELSGEPGSWLELLRRLHARLDGLRVRVLLDERALQDARFFASGPIVAGPVAVRPTAAVEALMQHHLAVLVHDATVLITTHDGLRQFERQVDQRLPVALVNPDGWLARALESSWPVAWGWYPLETWEADGRSMPWAADTGSRIDGLSEPGWMPEMFEVNPHDLPRTLHVTLYSQSVVNAGAWAAFALWGVATAWLLRGWRRWMGVVLGLAAALACWLSPPLTTIGAGMFLGACAGVLLSALRPTYRVAPSPSSRRLGLQWLAVGAAILVMLTAFWSYAQDESSSDRSRPATEVFRVLIPVDEAGEPVGDYLYIPRAFQELLLHYSESDRLDQPWIASAHYAVRGPVADSDVIELRAGLAVNNRVAQTIELPFKRSEVQLLTATLDREPADVRWNPAGDALIVVLNAPGRHDIDLTLGARRPLGGLELDIAIPRAAATTCDWNVTGKERMEFPLARGAVAQLPKVSEASLGSAPRLVVRTATLSSDEAGMVATVDRLAWLRVRPNSVVLDLKLQIQSMNGRLDEVLLRVDPRLRLLPLAGNHPFEGEPQIVEGEPDLIRWRLKPTTGSRFSTTLGFHWVNTSGVGRLDVPRVELVQTRATRDWLAVSSGGTLQLAASTSAAPQVNAAAFLDAWGVDGDVPWTVFDATLATDLFVEARFPPVQTEWSDTTSVEVGADRLQIIWEAQLASTTGPLFLRRLQVPADFLVRSVSVEQDGKQQDVRHALGDRGELTVFVSTPLARQRLSVVGELPVPRSGVVEFPRLRLIEGEPTSSVARITRRQNVAGVTLENAATWQSEDVPPTEPQELRGGRLVGVWQLPTELPSGPPPRLRLLTNQVRADGFLATRLVRNGGQWQAEVEYHLRVAGGLQDSVRLELPADWEGPYELEPAHPFELKPLPGQNRRELTIRPPQPITDTYRVKLRGALAATGERVRRVPDVLPLDVQRVLRFLVVPTQLETQSLVWATSGLQARALPPFFEMSEQMTETWETYQILGNYFHAAIQRVERVSGFPQIRLADVHVDVSENGHYCGIVQLDLEPGGSAECAVEPPPGGILLAAFVDGLPTTLRPGEQGKSLLRLGSPQLPQRVELIFTVNRKPTAESWQAHMPVINGFPVARTLWTVHTPWSGEGQQVLDEEGRVAAARQELTRLESAAQIIDLAYDVAAESGPSEAASWLQLWTSRAARARQGLRRQPAGLDARETAALAERLVALESQWQTEARRYGPDTLATLLGSQRRPPADLRQAWDFSRSLATYTSTGSFPGSVTSLTVQPPPQRTPWLARTLMTLVALLLGAASTVVRYRGLRIDLVREYPHTVLALVGLVCLVTLQPAVVGWTIVAVAVLLALRGAGR